MKKSLLLLASAALLFAGCAKEMNSPADGEMVDCTFTASMPDVATKAVADGDGNGVNANRCVMEVYYDGELYTRQVAVVTSLKASFTTQLVSNRTYTVAFWADHVASTSALDTDLYYTTNGENGLQEVSLKGTYAGNNDARDAFFHTGSYTVAQGGSTFTATLYRPFAQINVITNDWDKVSKISALKPSGVDVTINNPLVKFNAVTGVASADENVTSLNYSASVYTSPAPVEPVSETEKTLSMDYLFASTDEALINIDWKATKSDNDDVEYSFSNIPYKRNHRTNIKGALLTTTGQWNVTVDPIWDEPDYEKVAVVSKTVQDIDGANTFVADNAGADEYNVTFSTEPNDSGTPDGSASSAAHALLTTPLAEGNVMNVTVETDTKTLYVGDYPDQNTVTSLTTATTYAATVNLTVPVGKKIDNLIINAPSKSVYLNGQLVSNTGTLTNVESTTSAHTLVVENGQRINKLTVHQGGVEIHELDSTYVKKLVISEDAHTTNPVKFRACEHLSPEVFDVIYKEGDHDYIDRPTWVEKANATETGAWDIVESVCMINETNRGYASIYDAVAAASSTTKQTIKLLKDIKLSDGLVLVTKSVDFDLNGLTLSDDTDNYCIVYEAENLTEDIVGKVSNGTITCKRVGVCADDTHAIVTVEGLTITSTELTAAAGSDAWRDVPLAVSYGATMTVNSGTYTGNYAGASIYNSGGNLNINGGSFIGTGTGENENSIVVFGTQYDQSGRYQSITTITDGEFKGNLIMLQNESPSLKTEINISGGIYSVKPDESYLADHCTVVDNTDPETMAAYPYTIGSEPSFSVSATKKVYFSKGNLYWDGSKWHFEEHQWDFHHTDYTASHVCYFFYSKTASVAYASSYNDPGKASTDGLWCGEETPLTVEGQSGEWYALTYNETGYLLSTREINGKKGEGYSRQRTTLTLSDNSTVYGLIIVPDQYSGTPALASTTSWETWQTMEAAGCVFLPAEGYGKQSSGGTANDDHGRYWYGGPNLNSSTSYGSCLDFSEYNFSFWGNQMRNQALSVRLVQN